jgi:hypothetical protein
MFERVATENNLSDTPGNILNTNVRDIQVNNKPDSSNRKEVWNVHVVTSGEDSETVRVIACHDAGGQILRSVLLFSYVNKKQEFGDGIPPGLDLYMNRNSSYISTDLFNKSPQSIFSNTRFREVVLLLDGHRARCSFPLLL